MKEEREESKANPKMKAAGDIYINEKLLQKLLRLTKPWGFI